MAPPPETCKRRNAEGVCGVIVTQTGGLRVRPARAVCVRCTDTPTPNNGKFNRETTLLALGALKQYGHPTRYTAAVQAWQHIIDGVKPKKRRLGETRNAYQPQGPGTCLHEDLMVLRFKERDDCDCVDYATAMNIHGSGWCSNHIPHIMGWLRKSAKQRKLPFSKLVARQLIKKAIRRSQTMANLTDTFDGVYCVNLTRRADRWDKFLDKVPTDWPFRKIQRFKAIDGKRVPAPKWFTPGGGAWGCYRSHVRIIEDSLNNGIDSILLLEDDAVFSSDFTEQVADFLSRVPNDWGMLYLGGQHLNVDQSTPKEVCQGVFRPFNVNRTHAFALRGRTKIKVYKHLMSRELAAGHHIDHHLGRLHQRRQDPIYCPEKWLVGQADGKSNISGRDLPEKFWPSAGKIVEVDPSKELFVACLGLHSSGSSCLAGVLHHLGIHMGNSFVGYYGDDPATTNCGFEALGLRNVCEAALPFPAVEYKMNRANMWRKLRGFVRQKQREAMAMETIAGGKYPQLCALGRQLGNICGANLRVIVSDRPIAESVESMCRRMPKVGRDVIQAHQQFLFDKRRGLLSTLEPAQVLWTNYHDLLEDPEGEARVIAKWLEREPTTKQIEAVKTWVRPEKMHVELEGVA